MTTPQFFAGLLLLVLSAAFKAAVRALDSDSSSMVAADVPRLRLAARLAQYLSLVAGTVVLVTPDGSAGRTAILLLFVFFLYLVLLLTGRVAATFAPAGMLRLMNLPLRAWSVIAAPLVGISYRADSWVQRRRRGEQRDEDERLQEWLESSGLSGDDLALLRNAVRFRERTVGEVMVPRPDVIWLSLDDDPQRVMERVRESGHSRFPLCDESPDKPLGYVHVRDMGLLARAPSGRELRRVARPVSFVPETADATSLLRRFQREQGHMAVVVDEFGGTAGIVTLEDLLEELVGEIRDEFDDEEEVEVTRLQSGEVLVDGGVRLDDLERDFGVSFGDVDEETVGGFVFGRLAREVSAGDEVGVEGAILRVEGVEGLRVTRVRVIPATPAEAPEPA
ncbi:MAG TPA: hemolysin family protein [Trueperaceae bacterium]